jgi:hypothetical protein
MARNPRNRYEQELGSQVTFYWQLDEVLSDANYKANPERWNNMPGAIRHFSGKIGEGSYRNIKAHGPVKFKWVCNRTGATLPRGTATSFYAASITATGGSTSTIVCAAGTFVANEQVGNIVYILDDAGAAGAAPESEWGVIIANTTTTLTVQTAETNQLFTAAVAAGDTARIVSNSQVVACTAPGGAREPFAGIVVRAAGIPDNYWGWIAMATEDDGYVAALIEAGTAITVGLGLRVASGANGTAALSRLEPSIAGSIVQGEVVGHAVFACAADVVSDLIPVQLRPGFVDEA